MNKNVLKRGAIWWIIVLLFLLSFSPAMSTLNMDDYETTFKTNLGINKLSTPPYEDYVHAFWKLDEGNGVTAHDETDHSYDGTIYGADWSDGIANYSLDFDGVNDYVTFDDYDHLGFNKTDDVIFSFYLNTTSTQKGTIFSLSNNYGVYPNIDIFLDANGSIEFSFYVQYCGYSIYTENSFNDGEWYLVEIYYNGVSANPTMSIYVDGELEAEKTQWICHYAYAGVTEIKMGRNSNDSTAFYEGKIDEFKMIKFPGGNDQAKPDITGPEEGSPHVEYDFSFITNDPEEDEVWLWVDWDDGTIQDWIGPYDSGEEVILSHEYDEVGLYNLTAKSMDIWDDGPPSHHSIRIGDQPPDPPIISGPEEGDIDEYLQYAFVTNDYEDDDIELYIEWDDGSFEDWSGPYESGEEVIVGHSWTEKNSYQIRARARDELGVGEWSDPFTVIIGNDPPDKPTITGPDEGKVNEDLTFQFVANEPDGDNIFYWITWGDGQTVENFGPYESGTEIELTHSWDKKDDFVIEAWAIDEHGAEGEKATLAIVIPKNKAFIYNFNWIFTKLLDYFPILKFIIGNI